jgi:hypothetical protein
LLKFDFLNFHHADLFELVPFLIWQLTEFMLNCVGLALGLAILFTTAFMAVVLMML